MNKFKAVLFFAIVGLVFSSCTTTPYVIDRGEEGYRVTNDCYSIDFDVKAQNGAGAISQISEEGQLILESIEEAMPNLDKSFQQGARSRVDNDGQSIIAFSKKAGEYTLYRSYYIDNEGDIQLVYKLKNRSQNNLIWAPKLMLKFNEERMSLIEGNTLRLTTKEGTYELVAKDGGEFNKVSNVALLLFRVDQKVLRPSQQGALHLTLKKVD